jgi:hypothetical protein
MSVYPHGKRWRAQPEYRGLRGASKLFDTKAEARAYRDTQMTELRLRFDSGVGVRKTLADAIARYLREVSPKHKGHHWEKIRLDAFVSQFNVNKQPSDIQPVMLRAWLDERRKQVSDGSVLREIGLVSSVFTCCVKDWGWLSENPFSKVRKPAQPKSRDRVMKASEIRKMLRGWDTSVTSHLKTCQA